MALAGNTSKVTSVRAFHNAGANATWTKTFTAAEISDLKTASDETAAPYTFTGFYNVFSFNFLDETKALPNQVNFASVNVGDKSFNF